MPSRCYGWDVGGAHLKFVALDTSGALADVCELACPLWQGPQILPDAITSLRARHGLREGLHAITMTGELCDAFASRAEGVSTILDVIEAALGGTVCVYGADGWLSPAAARARVDAVASVNWHATAAFVAAGLGDAMLVDVGSTTSDLVPCVAGTVAARGFTDAARLVAGELVYTGVARTPVMAVVQHVPTRGHWCGVAAEHFATMADVYRLTGELPEGADLFPTSDRRPADIPHSRRRLARMLGEDARPGDASMLDECARFIAQRQLGALLDAFALVASRGDLGRAPATLVGAGVGSFLAERMARARGAHFLDFATLAGVAAPYASRVNAAAAAYALARLAQERAA